MFDMMTISNSIWKASTLFFVHSVTWHCNSN